MRVFRSTRVYGEFVDAAQEWEGFPQEGVFPSTTQDVECVVQEEGAFASSGTALGREGFLREEGAGTKRGRDDEEDEEDEEDGEPQTRPEPQTRREPQRKRIKLGEPGLACPFQKRYPEKNVFCGKSTDTRGFTTIARLKQHIRRCHLPKGIFCPRCQITFADSPELVEHTQRYTSTEACEARPLPPRDHGAEN